LGWIRDYRWDALARQERHMNWIKEVDGYNFLGIYDVMLDIKREMNISPDIIIIPRSLVRYIKIPYNTLSLPH
jgi:hypothetical protein